MIDMELSAPRQGWAQFAPQLFSYTCWIWPDKKTERPVWTFPFFVYACFCRGKIPCGFYLLQRTASSSTSKIRVAPGGMALPAPRSPYARSEGNSYCTWLKLFSICNIWLSLNQNWKKSFVNYINAQKFLNLTQNNICQFFIIWKRHLRSRLWFWLCSILQLIYGARIGSAYFGIFAFISRFIHCG